MTASAFYRRFRRAAALQGAGALLALAALSPAALAQGVAPAPAAFAPPQNVLQLSASGQIEVQQDMLTLALTTTREGADPAAVQAELRKAVDAALAQLKPAVQPGQMDLRTGDFNVHPSYGREGKITGWQGRAELILEGRDFPRITQAAARAGTMSIGRVSFGLSREQRARVEGEAQTQAIERFKARAAEIARAFGFAGYTLREVSVSGEGGEVMPRTFAMARAAGAPAAASDAPISVEPGKSTVRVTVSGTVQAR